MFQLEIRSNKKVIAEKRVTSIIAQYFRGSGQQKHIAYKRRKLLRSISVLFLVCTQRFTFFVKSTFIKKYFS